MKRTNPYTRLLTEIKDWMREFKCSKTVTMWTYPKEKLKNVGWNLYDLRERVDAAEELGYDVLLKSTPDGLKVMYQKKAPFIPFEWGGPQ